MLEWHVLPAPILVVILAIVTARPRHIGQGRKDGEPEE
jgi:hypothetical protein